MNSYIETQVQTMQLQVELFLKACILAAETDDGKIDKKEQKQINKIEKLSNQYIRGLEKIK